MSLWYVWRKPSTYLALTLTLSPNGLKQDSTQPSHLRVPSEVSKTIYEPRVCSVQTVHLSCVKISTISKWTERSFHLSLVTWETHPVHAKWFLCLWYVQCKPCIYLALTQTLPPNGLKRDSTRPMSLMSSIGCLQNYLWAYGMFSANRAHILHQD
jgi:hypothetical protein